MTLSRNTVLATRNNVTAHHVTWNRLRLHVTAAVSRRLWRVSRWPKRTNTLNVYWTNTTH